MNYQELAFKSSFPEDLYIPAAICSEDYIQRVFFGFEEMSKKSVTIGLMARNIGNIIDYTILRVNRIKRMFRSSNIIWLENDSTDNTREKIIRSCESQTFLSDCRKEILIGEDYDDSYEHNRKRIAELKTMEFQQDKSFNRCRRMAHCRNILRDNMVKYDTDYYAILDTDLLGGFSYEGIANSFSYDWDCCASNSLIYINEQRYYYDSWAWRDLNHPNPHSDEEINPRRYERGERPINVMSAFGGLAIYNNKYFPNLKYRYSSTDCDHPTIHIPMSRDGAKIVMNPSQIALYNKTRYVV